MSAKNFKNKKIKDNIVDSEVALVHFRLWCYNGVYISRTQLICRLFNTKIVRRKWLWLYAVGRILTIANSLFFVISTNVAGLTDVSSFRPNFFKTDWNMFLEPVYYSPPYYVFSGNNCNHFSVIV